MLGLIKKCFFPSITFINFNLSHVNSFECVSMNNETRPNETRHIKWHKTCKCRCRLDASICNNNKRWNDDK